MSRKKLADILQQEKRWFEYNHLRKLTPEEQIDELCEMFSLVVKERDDETAARTARWIVAAVDDLNDPSGKVESPTLDATECARHLFLVLTDALDSDGFMYCPMLETKKALLSVIIRYWSMTSDEDESDELFDFLCDIRSEDKREWQMIEALIREGTGPEFPYDRAVRQHLRLLRKDDWVGSEYGARAGIARTLAMAWARNASEHEQKRMLSAILPLTGVIGEGAHKALATFSGWLANRISDTNPLRGRLCDLDPKLQVEVGFDFSDDVREAHPEPGQFVVGCSVIVTTEGFGKADEVITDDGSLVEDHFPDIHRCVTEWLEHDGGFLPILLKVNHRFEARPGQEAKSVTVRRWYD